MGGCQSFYFLYIQLFLFYFLLKNKNPGVGVSENYSEFKRSIYMLRRTTDESQGSFRRRQKFHLGRQIDQVMVTWSPGLRITRGSNQEISNKGSETNCAQKE